MIFHFNVVTDLSPSAFQKMLSFQSRLIFLFRFFSVFLFVQHWKTLMQLSEWPIRFIRFLQTSFWLKNILSPRVQMNVEFTQHSKECAVYRALITPVACNLIHLGASSISMSELSFPYAYSFFQNYSKYLQCSYSFYLIWLKINGLFITVITIIFDCLTEITRLTFRSFESAIFC